VPGVPADLLRPRDTWSDRDAYDAAATQLAEMFRKNFERFAAQVPEEVRSSGPR
jgi:phosphoenolpyruvate carboxykinase (ATP)